MVPYSAGGGTDTVSRLIGENMSRTLGQTVLVENVVGAGGTLANDRVARSTPDGSTVLINHVALLAAPSLFNDLRYDENRLRAGRPRQQCADGADRPEIDSRQQPERLRRLDQGAGRESEFAHGGTGTNSHLCGVMMGNVLGFKATFVPYRGSAPAINDLLGGQVDLLWDQLTNALSQIQSGALHGIAITSPERLEQVKDVPTTAELGMPELSYTMWHGLYVAKGTPKPAIDALNAALRKAVADPAWLRS